MIGTGQANIPPRNQSPIEGITVEKMLGNDIKVSKTGEVTGTIKYLSDVPGYDEGQNNGHFFPTVFDEKNYKPLHVGGEPSDSGFTAGKDFEPSKEDPYLVIRVENCTDNKKVSVYDSATKEVLFTLDFNKASLGKQPTKIKTSVKTPVMSVQEAQEEPLEYTDEDITLESETTVEKHYTKSEINRMNTEDLQALAVEKGIEGAYDMTGSELKPILIEMLVN